MKITLTNPDIKFQKWDWEIKWHIIIRYDKIIYRDGKLTILKNK